MRPKALVSGRKSPKCLRKVTKCQCVIKDRYPCSPSLRNIPGVTHGLLMRQSFCSSIPCQLRVELYVETHCKHSAPVGQYLQRYKRASSVSVFLHNHPNRYDWVTDRDYQHGSMLYMHIIKSRAGNPPPACLQFFPSILRAKVYDSGIQGFTRMSLRAEDSTAPSPATEVLLVKQQSCVALHKRAEFSSSAA